MRTNTVISRPSGGTQGDAGDLVYVLVTPARNEAAFIERTIRSVLVQTSLPARWIIVSDGSTDGTDEIVKKYTDRYEWIQLVRMPERKERHFAGKVYAFNAGYARLGELSYDIVGNLDADISFDKDYFSFLISRFADDTKLGVAGTPFREGTRQYDYRFTSIDHVSGACQLFRRECFEAVGGYKPIRGGGIDWVAVTTARMKGWHTQTFCEKVCIHGRPIGTAQGTGLAARFRLGIKDYSLGGHLLWAVFRSLYQMKTTPYVLGGGCMFSGYIWAFLSRVELSVPRDLVEFHQKEQMNRLKALFIGMLRPNKL